MTTQTMPEIAPSDLQAALEFLTSGRLEPLPKPSPKPARSTRSVAVHHGITRARNRSTVRRVGA